MAVTQNLLQAQDSLFNASLALTLALLGRHLISPGSAGGTLTAVLLFFKA
jgi:hypothetical protein